MDATDRAVFGGLEEPLTGSREEAVRVATKLLGTAMNALPRDRDRCPPLLEEVSRDTVTCRKAHTNFYPANMATWDSFDNLLDRVEKQPYALHRAVFFGTGAGAYGESMQTQAKDGIRAAIEDYAFNAFGANIWDRDGFRRRLNDAMVEQAYDYAYRADPPALQARILPGAGADFLSKALSLFYTAPPDPASDPPAGATLFGRTIPRELHKRVALLASFVYGAAMDMRKAHLESAPAVP